MASRTDLSEFESSSKRPKYDSSDPEDSNICPDTSFGQYSTSSESQFDACEGVSTDSGFNEVPHYDTESQESTQESYPASPNPLKESAPNIDVQIVDRINALQMRGLSDVALWRALAAQLFAPPPRQRLQHVSKLADVVRLIRNSRNVLVLTGAGVSVSCGIPDFRSRDGIYARLAVDFPDLPDPHAMFDSSYFRLDPRPFFKFAREIYPGRFTPSPCHRFIRALENHGRLLRNYTQNIDTLERSAGISRVVECHGSFADAACTRCERTVKADYIRDDIFAQRIPVCEVCNPGVKSVSAMDDIDFRELVANGVMKPNIVFFGEGLPKRFHKWIRVDRTACDLLLVIGSSLKVRPVAEIPGSLPSHVPQVLINRERLPHCTSFDVELLGDSDVIINQICHMLGESWGDVCWKESLKKADKLIVPEKLQNVIFNPQNDQQPTNSDIESELHESSERENVSFFSENCCNYENGRENEMNTRSDYSKIEKLKSIPDPSYTPQFAEDSCSNNWNMEHLNQIPMTSTSTFENCETKEVTSKHDVNNSNIVEQNSKFENNSNVLNDVDVEMESESVYDPPTEKNMAQIEEKKSLKRPASVMLSEDDETKTDGSNKKSCTLVPVNEISTEREGAQMDLLPTEQNNLSLSMDADHCESSSKIQTLHNDFESTNNESCTSPTKESSFYDDDDEDDNSSDESMGQSKESSYDSDSSSSTVSSDDLNCDDESSNQSSDLSSQDDDCSLLFENFGEQERQIDDNTDSVQNTEQPDTELETEEADHRPPERHTSTESTYDSGIDEDYARYKISLSDCLPINSYYYKKPNVYIFPGAEVKLKRKYLRCFR